MAVAKGGRHPARYAQRRELRVSDVPESFRIGPRTAAAWLRRFAAEGVLVPSSGNVRITAYRLNGKNEIALSR